MKTLSVSFLTMTTEYVFYHSVLPHIHLIRKPLTKTSQGFVTLKTIFLGYYIAVYILVYRDKLLFIRTSNLYTINF